MKQQSIITRLISSTLAASLAVSPASLALGNQPESPASEMAPLYQNDEFSTENPKATEQILRNQTSPLSYEQLLDYAMTQMQQDQFREAVVLYEQAVRHASTDENRVFAMMWHGQALLDSANAVDDDARMVLYRRAGMVFNRASQLSPASPEAAAMRVAAWTNANDQLELSAAEHDLRRLGVELEGEEVFLAAGTILALTFAASVGTYVAYTLSSDLTDEEKLDRLEKVMKVCAAAMWAAKPKAPSVLSPLDY